MVEKMLSQSKAVTAEECLFSVRVAYGQCCFQSGRESKTMGGRKPHKITPERLGIYQDDKDRRPHRDDCGGQEAVQG